MNNNNDDDDNETGGRLKGDIEVPIKINPNQRKKNMKEWPRPTSLQHKEKSNSIMNFTTSGPLFSYKVLILLTPLISYKKREPYALCEPRILEIFIRPNVCEVGSISELLPSSNVVIATTSSSNSSSNSNSINNDPIETLSNPSSITVSTPQASLAIPKVTAEAISLGPAAILRDRTNRSQQPFRTPRNFAQLYEVVPQQVVVLTNTPQYSPTMAQIYQTPRVQEDDDSNILSVDTNDENINSSNFDENNNSPTSYPPSPSATCRSNTAFNMSTRTPSAIIGMSRRGIAETIQPYNDFGVTLPSGQYHDEVEEIFHQPYIGRLSFAQ